MILSWRIPPGIPRWRSAMPMATELGRTFIPTRFPHMRHAARTMPGQPLHLARARARWADTVAGAECARCKSAGRKLPDSLAVPDVAPASGDPFRHPRQCQHHPEAVVAWNLAGRNPIRRGQFHRNRLHSAGRQLCRYRIQILREGTGRLDRVRAAVRTSRGMMGASLSMPVPAQLRFTIFRLLFCPEWHRSSSSGYLVCAGRGEVTVEAE